jgi:hypothetical protein
MTEQTNGLDRRAFLRRAAAVGAAVWSAPLLQTVAATPAFAQVQGTRQPCFKSGPGSCMEACTGTCSAQGFGQCGEACDGLDPDPCGLYNGQGPCQNFCPSAQGGGNPCCNAELCNPANFTFVSTTCNTGHGPPKPVTVATYHGSIAGC